MAGFAKFVIATSGVTSLSPPASRDISRTFPGIFLLETYWHAYCVLRTRQRAASFVATHARKSVE